MTYEQENNQILKFALENTYFKTFKKSVNELTEEEKRYGLELYITPDCNQKCSYCYLQKNKEGLYPHELNNKIKIIENLNILIDYLLENKMNPCNIDVFTGDIWDTDFGMQILDILLEAAKNGLTPEKIMIPSNFSFILNDYYADKIEMYVSEFAKYKVGLKFSCSNDGYYIDTMTRPFNDKDKNKLKSTEEYYNKLFKYCKRTHFAFHPMVSAHGIEYWQENFKWWMENLIKYDFDPLSFIMFLETRNDDWTEEKIIHYLKYLEYSMNYYEKEICHGDFQEFLDIIGGGPSLSNKKKKHVSHYMPFKTNTGRVNMSCAVSKMLCIRLGDLAIAPCHRTSYEEFLLGKFIIKDNKIIDVEAKNIQMMNEIWFSSYHGWGKCNQCPLNEFCLKGCFGSQYESTGDVLYPCSTVCDLFWAKAVFLYRKYNTPEYRVKNSINMFIKTMEKYQETKEFRKWNIIIQNNL